MNRPTRDAACSLLLISLAACAASAPGPADGGASAAAAVASAVAAPDPKVLGAWRIEQARSAPLTDKRAARIDFGADGRLTGNASCNGLTASYTLAGDKLTIGKIATTRKACSEALMEQEDRVLTALERAARASVPLHGFLTLHDADGSVLMRASRFETQ